MREPAKEPGLLNEAQMLLAQFVFGKMREVPSTSEGVEQLKKMNVPFVPAWWFANDFLYPQWHEYPK